MHPKPTDSAYVEPKSGRVSAPGAGDEAFEAHESRLQLESVPKAHSVGQCRLTVSKLVLKAPVVSALESIT